MRQTGCLIAFGIGETHYITCSSKHVCCGYRLCLLLVSRFRIALPSRSVSQLCSPTIRFASSIPLVNSVPYTSCAITLLFLDESQQQHWADRRCSFFYLPQISCVSPPLFTVSPNTIPALLCVHRSRRPEGWYVGLIVLPQQINKWPTGPSLLPSSGGRALCHLLSRLFLRIHPPPLLCGPP